MILESITYTREHHVSLIGINRGYDKPYNASAVTHELPEETKSAIHNRRVKSLTLQPGDRRLIIKTRWPALSSAFFRLRVTPVTSARRYRASSVINVKTVFAVVHRSSVSVLFLRLPLHLLLRRSRARCPVRKPEARKNRDNRRNCGKSTRGVVRADTMVSPSPQNTSYAERIERRSRELDTLPYFVASVVHPIRIKLEFTRMLCCARIAASHARPISGKIWRRRIFVSSSK